MSQLFRFHGTSASYKAFSKNSNLQICELSDRRTDLQQRVDDERGDRDKRQTNHKRQLEAAATSLQWVYLAD